MGFREGPAYELKWRERLRWRTRYQPYVERQERLCRFCEAEVENEVHALFECGASAQLVVTRLLMKRDLEAAGQAEDTRGCVASWEAEKWFEVVEWMLRSERWTNRLAKSVYDVLRIFEAREMRRPQ